MGCTQAKGPKPGAKPTQQVVQPTAQPVRTETATAPTPAPPIPETPEEKALTQLKLIFESIDKDADGSICKGELTTALEKDPKLQEFIKDAGFQANKDSLDTIDTNKDGRVTWDEFKASLTVQAVKEIEQKDTIDAADLPAEEKAAKHLRSLFDGMDVNKDNQVDKKELNEAMKKDESLKLLLQESGVHTDWFVMEQLDDNLDGKWSWEEFEKYVKGGAKKQVQRTGEVAAAVPFIKVEDEKDAKGNLCC